MGLVVFCCSLVFRLWTLCGSTSLPAVLAALWRGAAWSSHGFSGYHAASTILSQCEGCRHGRSLACLLRDGCACMFVCALRFGVLVEHPFAAQSLAGGMQQRCAASCAVSSMLLGFVAFICLHPLQLATTSLVAGLNWFSRSSSGSSRSWSLGSWAVVRASPRPIVCGLEARLELELPGTTVPGSRSGPPAPPCRGSLPSLAFRRSGTRAGFEGLQVLP